MESCRHCASLELRYSGQDYTEKTHLLESRDKEDQGARCNVLEPEDEVSWAQTRSFIPSLSCLIMFGKCSSEVVKHCRSPISRSVEVREGEPAWRLATEGHNSGLCLVLSLSSTPSQYTGRTRFGGGKKMCFIPHPPFISSAQTVNWGWNLYLRWKLSSSLSL